MSTGLRSLASARERCDELARAMALSISLAIDPERASASPAARATPSAAKTASAAGTPDVSPPQAPRHALHAARAAKAPHVAAGAVAALGAGALPGVVFGGPAFGSWRERRWSATIEARALGSSGQALQGGGRLVDASRNAARYSGAEVWRAPLLSGLALVGIDTLFL